MTSSAPWTLRGREAPATLRPTTAASRVVAGPAHKWKSFVSLGARVALSAMTAFVVTPVIPAGAVTLSHLAAGDHPRLPTGASALTAPGPGLRTVVFSTANWSGYALVGARFTGVTGTFNVPFPGNSARCPEESSIWVGVDGMRSGDLLQAGVAESTFVTLDNAATPGEPPIMCTGQVQVYAWWEDLPSSPVRVSLPVTFGDEVTVSIFQMSPGWWALAMRDWAGSRSFLLAQPYGGGDSSVEWVVEATTVMGMTDYPLPVGTVDFRDLGAQGYAQDLVRMSFGSKGHVMFAPYVVTTDKQLLRAGFAVHSSSPGT